MFNSLLANSQEVFNTGFNAMGTLEVIVFSILVVVLLALKGYSLWTASKRGDKWWFIFIFLLNLIGILEIIYLIFVVKIWSKKHKHS